MSGPVNNILFHLMVYVLPWIIAVVICHFFLRGKLSSICLISLSVPAWIFVGSKMLIYSELPVQSDWLLAMCAVVTILVTIDGVLRWPRKSPSMDRK